tara:strand:+ start:1631 stop:1975 length:345 start_codon:yes stop_codon:yes gene_type:complete
MKPVIITIFLLFLFVSCKKDFAKNAMLMADREAPIGWNYLRIYKDSTFQFEYRSFPKSRFHEGIIKIINDTLNFEYFDSIPAFGNKAIIDRKYLIYTNGKYKEKLEVWLDSISE